jgi:probable F420-dependent oxidoreductase
MKIDASLPPLALAAVPSLAEAAEGLGFAALWCPETTHDPFLPGALIARHTRRLHFGSGVAIAFARSPATLAYTAWDLAQASGGRFILGLGTQVKPHIERRFGMPWPASVVGKLREQVGAIRSFWHTWQTGERLNFRGEYYRLNLMSPFFNPGPISTPDIPIYLAGVNPGLAKLAGEVAQGFLVHPLHTPAYLADVILPSIAQGRAQADRPRAGFEVAATVFVVTSPEEACLVRSQVAFYASTPSYRAVLARHGWEPIALELARLASRGQWEAMPELVDDNMLETFAVTADQADLPAALAKRYDGLVDRLALYIPFTPGERDPFWENFLRHFGAGTN